MVYNSHSRLSTRFSSSLILSSRPCSAPTVQSPTLRRNALTPAKVNTVIQYNSNNINTCAIRKSAAHTCRLDTGLRQAAAAAASTVAAFRPQRFLRLWFLAVAIPIVVLAIIIRSSLSFLRAVQEITRTADRFLLWICRTNEQQTISSETE